MADTESKKPENPKADLRRPPDNFVAKLVPDPAKPPDLIRLAGYRGASSHSHHVRLYANPELSIYWDIPEADVVYEQPVPHDVDPLGAVTLWIKRDCKITSNFSQQAQGGQQPMFPYPAGTGAAPQAASVPYQLTQSLQYTVTPQCISPYLGCQPISPLLHCVHSPYPHCVQPYSPYCPTTPHGSIPTSVPGSPVAGASAQAAAPQAASLIATTIGPLTHTLPPSIIAACPSQYIIHCPSVIIQCTIHNSLVCSPPVICAVPVSPTCTITQTIPTTPGTISDPASFAGGSLAAAPQAASLQFGPAGTQAQLYSPAVICFRPSPYIFCFPSYYYYQCHPSPTPICYYQASPVQTITQSVGTQSIGTQSIGTQSIGTGSIATGSALAGGGGGAAQQAFTFTPITIPTHGTPPTYTVPTIGPTYGPTFTVYPTPHTLTVTHTPVTFQ